MVTLSWLRRLGFAPIVIFCCLLSSSGFAWNALGHRIVAQIAYDNLTPQAKKTFTHYNQVINQHYKSMSFVNSAVWLDQLHGKEYAPFKPMHYIDIPYSMDGMPLPKINSVNAVWAVKMASTQLRNNNATDLDKGLALRILLHVVGDIHQPLHGITRISAAYPEGDRGGNLYPLYNNRLANNLHAYWDKGGGFIAGYRYKNASAVKRIARCLERQWPCAQFSDLDPMHWANESYELAVNTAYVLSNNEISLQYQQAVKKISQQRLAWAGCRLANLLNNLSQK